MKECFPARRGDLQRTNGDATAMKTIEVEGIELAVEDRGQGSPVVLVHGFPLNHSMWSAQIEHLSANYRVIAPDLRGFGKSTVTPGAVTMDRHADDLGAMLIALEKSQRSSGNPCVSSPMVSESSMKFGSAVNPCL